ncbi:syntaxin binding protein 1 [Dipsacomyces acuminosporus]|nr:syntaxin binding protein 1 [Dipsacomyces acuminosporus]
MLSARLLLSRIEFLKVLAGVRPSNRFKIVVVDKRSLRVLNDVLKLSEVLENDVIRIESIENGRKEDPSTEALYILTPSKQSVDRLIGDFAASQTPASSPSSRGFGLSSSLSSPATTAKQPTYRAAHVFFTSELPDSLFTLLKNPSIARYLMALKELCIEYDVHNGRVFLTKLADRPLYRLYSPLLANNCNEELDLISKKLVNVCGALKDDPVVRFFSPDPEVYGNTKARKLAFLFHTEMDRVRQALPPSPASGSGSVRTEIIIVDRSADPFAPILHEFTYEAMVYDLLDIEDGNKFCYTVELANGTEEVKTVVLDDADPVWQEYRFQHISDAQENIMKKFEELIGSNKAIVDMQSGEKLNLAKMRDVVSNIPQFKDQLSNISAHITIMQKCMEKFNECCLNDLGMIEQNLATGTTPDGEKYRSGDIDIAHVLNNPAVEPEDKLRLLLVYFISNPSLTESERLKLAQLAKLDRNARATIQNMGIVIRWAYALDLVKQLGQKQSQAVKGSKWALVSSMRSSGNLNQSQAEDELKPFDLSRYVPVAKHVLEACIEGCLSEDVFPYVVPPERPKASSAFASATSLRGSGPAALQPERAGAPAGGMWSSLVNTVVSGNQESRPPPSPHSPHNPNGPQRQVRSLRSARPTWQKRDGAPSTPLQASTPGGLASTQPQHDSHTPASASSPPSQQRGRSQQPRIILFVIGGVTYSEVRAAGEIGRKYGREVLVGSTNMLTPVSYLKEVSTLNFELVGDDGRPLDMRPSFVTLGYGGPADVDPLSAYVVPSAKQKSSQGLSQNKNPDTPASSRSPASPRAGSRSQESAAQAQQRSAGRVASYQSGANGESQRPLASRGSLRSAGSGRSTTDMRASSASPHEYGSGSKLEQRARHEKSASPRANETSFSAGFQEYRQQQAMRNRNGHASPSSPSSSSSFHMDAVAKAVPPLPQNERPKALSVEEAFRAKFEKSQREWNAQLTSPTASVNPASISEMHKVSLGSKGRSEASPTEKKHNFFKRIL